MSDRGVFWFVIALAGPTLIALWRIRGDDIDHVRARGEVCDGQAIGARGVRTVLRDRPLRWFLVCAVLFHFANAAMLPLLGELLGKGRGRGSMLFMSACVITTQLVITLSASGIGRLAQRGRKPILLLGFAVLPVRGVLYILTSNAALLISIQVLDGIAAGVFNVVSTLVIADRTRGSGRFNFALAAVTTAVGIGAALSQVIAGSIAHHVGTRASFGFLAAVAALAFVLLLVTVPETRGRIAPAEADRRTSA